MDIYEVFAMISSICTVLCVLCVILSIVIFFLFQIPKTIGFLSGSTAKKSVQQLMTATAASGPIGRKAVKAMNHSPMEEKKAEGGSIMAGQEGTNATSVLSAGATSVLMTANASAEDNESGATSLLAEAGATALLNEADPLIMSPKMQYELGMGLTSALDNNDTNITIGTFEMIKDIVLTHSEEVV